MSSNYRSGGGGGGYRGRGGYGGFRGGRGGGFKPRRYWDRDDDDYHRRSRDRDRRDRRSRSRSRSRSDSRSDSRSRSRSRGRDRDRGRERSRTPDKGIDRERGRQSSPHRSPQYPPPTNQFSNPVMQTKEQYEPSYVPGSGSSVAKNSEIPSYMTQQQSAAMLTNSQNGQIGGSYNIPSQTQGQYPADQYQHQQVQYQMANYQKQQQLQQAQAEAYKIVSGGGQNTTLYNETAPLGFIPPSQLPDTLYQHQPKSMPPPAPTLSKMEDPTSGLPITPAKKKKELKKKKKRRKSSSSSSSSSSSDSSDERTSSKRKQKSKSKRDSDDSSDSSSDEENREKGKAGVLTAQQREALEKQGDGYRKKLEIFEREIKRLRAKEDELALAKADMKLIEENLRLQGEIVGRCKAVNIVLEKINAVLHGGTMDAKPRPVPPPPPKISQLASPQRQQVTLVSSPPLRMDNTKSFDFFDNGLHWCRLCNVFPETLSEMLSHYHSPDHHAQVEQLGMDEKPWRKRNSLKETKPEPGAKKVPFRGLQFFTPVQGWYCRICSAWIGDPECATEHLKSAEHCNNYANFLDEHPDWEMKWMADRAKARARSGLAPEGSTSEDIGPRPRGIKGGKYSFETDEAKGVGVRYQPGKDFENDEYAKSIRVQMRNISKENEARSYSEANLASANMVPINSKDTTVEEWMGKTQPQVSLDIDTQKFAAIVRQKHGAKEKEAATKKAEIQPPSQQISRVRERDMRDSDSKRNNFDNNRRYDSRVEMSFGSGRDRDRDRERDRERERERGGGRGGRRRSRSKSRERSREAERSRRRDRSRSRSRGRDHDRSRDGKDKEKDHQIRRLPIIGKMPLFKKPAKEVESSKDKDTAKGAEAEVQGEYGPVSVSTDGAKSEDATAVAAAALAYGQSAVESGMSEYGGYYDAQAAGYGYENFVSHEAQVEVPIYHQVLVQQLTEEMKPPGETNAAAAAIPTPVVPPTSVSTGSSSTGPGGLPDDLQHALDIIYSGGGAKATTIPFPPPGVPVTQAQQNYDYSSGGYGAYMDMGYDPYQHSFEGYVPVSEYGDMSDAPPGVSEAPAMNGSVETASGESKDTKSDTNPQPSAAESESDAGEPAAPGDDDFEDLRMLGIDVGDAAVVHMK